MHKALNQNYFTNKSIEFFKTRKPIPKKTYWKNVLFTLIFVSLQGISQPNTSPPLPIPPPITTDVLNNNLQVGYCIKKAGSGSCTAQDFKITAITTVNVDDGCSSQSDYMQIDIDVSFQKAVPTRYDVAAWFYRGVDLTSANLDFNNLAYAQAIDGAFCNRVGLQPGLSIMGGSGTSGNVDGDACTDIAGSAGTLTPMRINDVILPCRDISSPKDGVTDISACSSWQNNANQVCSTQFYTEAYPWANSPTAGEMAPNTKSKCNCGEFDGGPLIITIPNMSVTKSCTPDDIAPGETTTCTITLTNSGNGPLMGAEFNGDTGFFYQDDYPETQGTVDSASITPVQPATANTVEDRFILNSNGTNSTNQALNIYPGDIAAGASFVVTYGFITTTDPSVPNTDPSHTITNTVCLAHYDSAEPKVFAYPDEDGNCATDVVTTPVSISSFIAKTDQFSEGYDFTWTTSTETGNLGFNIYAIVGQTRFKLNEELIVSKVVDSMEMQEYSYQLDSPFNGLANKFILEDVDRLGKRHSNGIYKLGEQYGVANSVSMQKETDWSNINLESEKFTTLKNKALVKQLNTKLTNKSAQPSTIKVQMEINKTGIYKVSYEDLIALGIDLSNVNTSMINVISADGLIAIDLHTVKKNPLDFTKGSFFQFYAKTLDTLYANTHIYTLSFNHETASPVMDVVSAAPRGNQFVTSYNKTERINRNQIYSFASPIANEPWYDSKLLAVKSPLTSYFNLNANNFIEGDAGLSIRYWGGLDFPDDNLDHSIKFRINGNDLGSDKFDGIESREKTFSISGNLLKASNEVELILPVDTKNQIDLISLESMALTYQSRLITSNDLISFQHDYDNNFSVAGFVNPDVYLYAIQDETTVKLKNYKTKPAINYTNSVQFSGLSGPTGYIIVGQNAVITPVMHLSESKVVSLKATEHLVIAHSNFIGWPLKNYAKTTRQNYRIVDVQDIYNLYSGSVADGEAIKSFISDIAQNGDLKSVLLVGGDTYDYKNYKGLDSISFVPTIYRETDELIKFSAVDALFGDINNDNVPDVPVGRFPVRTVKELETIIAKSNIYRTQVDNLTAILSADDSELKSAYQFTTSSNQIASQLEQQDWSISTAYLDNKTIEEARIDLLTAMNDGTRLAIYTGHSSSRHWSFDGLFKNTDIKTLNNFDTPLGVIQWGCWNTYFVDPKEDSLGHEFMLAGKQGAAFVVGASTLTNAGQESYFSKSFHRLVLENDETIGSAMIKAKQEFANRNRGLQHKDILWGINILGDPLIKVQ